MLAGFAKSLVQWQWQWEWDGGVKRFDLFAMTNYAVCVCVCLCLYVSVFLCVFILIVIIDGMVLY